EFQSPHFARLEQALRGIPTAHVRIWGDQLGVDGATLLHDWPKNLLGVFRLLLSADAARRPASVAELRSWPGAPAPAPGSAALALRGGAGEARIHLDLRRLDADAQVVVRCRPETSPVAPTDGELVEEGPPHSPVIDRRQPLPAGMHYGLFTRRKTRQGRVYSRALPATLPDPSP